MRATEGVSRETQERLDTYVDMLHRWNARIRLIGPDLFAGSDPVADSLFLARLLPGPVPAALDIGSGNGFPALPLSIAFGIPFVLVESDRRKAAFLREVTREVGCPATVEAVRIEHLAPGSFSLITARAFGSLSRLVALAQPRQAPGTVCLFPKGRTWAAELADAGRDWSFSAVSHPHGPGAVIEVASIVRRTP